MDRHTYYNRIDELLKEYEIIVTTLALEGPDMTFSEYQEWLNKKHITGHKIKGLYNDIKPEKFI